MLLSMLKNKSDLPEGIPKWEQVFFERAKQFTQHVNFIIDEQAEDISNAVCDEIYEHWIIIIQDILNNPDITYCIMPFNPHEQFDYVVAHKVEVKLQKRVFIMWKDFFIQSTQQDRTVHRWSYIRFLIKYGTIDAVVDTAVNGIIFIKKVWEEE